MTEFERETITALAEEIYSIADDVHFFTGEESNDDYHHYYLRLFDIADKLETLVNKHINDD